MTRGGGWLGSYTTFTFIPQSGEDGHSSDDADDDDDDTSYPAAPKCQKESWSHVCPLARHQNLESSTLKIPLSHAGWSPFPWPLRVFCYVPFFFRRLECEHRARSERQPFVAMIIRQDFMNRRS